MIMSALNLSRRQLAPWILMFAGLLLTTAAYLPGLSGSWLFDDYPNIVENPAVHPERYDLASLLNAALSSPASEFKRPLASMTFALNYLASGMNAHAMKVTNLVIHLANGILVFLLMRALFNAPPARAWRTSAFTPPLVATAWLLLSINLTSVLYVVQRMESLANLFVLLGLITYIKGRGRMQGGHGGFALSVFGVLACAAIGTLAKETAVLLPLYAALVEQLLFRWQRTAEPGDDAVDKRIVAFFIIFLVVPVVAGCAWLYPIVSNPETWARRDFTLSTRLLSEARIVVDYIGWTFLPTPQALSFYHDEFVISTDIFHPWTTWASMLVLAILVAASWFWRKSRPFVSLGIAWYLGCHLLTGTVIPLELVYEHRNYFASLGLLLAAAGFANTEASTTVTRHLLAAVIASFFLWQTGMTFLTAKSWGDPMSLARELAYRGPDSPRAQYELGRTYIIFSNYDPSSPFVHLARAPLERAAAIDGSSILPEQALIFMSARMHTPIDPAWWQSMRKKLSARPATVQDESSLGALSDCLRQAACTFPAQELLKAYFAALGHPHPSGRLLAMYANFAWSSLNDRTLGIRVQKEAVNASPGEANYRIGLARMCTLSGDFSEARSQIQQLESMNIGGRLNQDIASLNAALVAAQRTKEVAEHD